MVLSQIWKKWTWVVFPGNHRYIHALIHNAVNYNRITRRRCVCIIVWHSICACVYEVERWFAARLRNHVYDFFTHSFLYFRHHLYIIRHRPNCRARFSEAFSYRYTRHPRATLEKNLCVSILIYLHARARVSVQHEWHIFPDATATALMQEYVEEGNTLGVWPPGLACTHVSVCKCVMGRG